MKKPKCKVCKQEFIRERPLQILCGFDCTVEYAILSREKKDRQNASKSRKEYREAKEKQKTRADWMREAQTVFNAYIRERDKELPCISSGRITGAWDAGHYRSIGSCPELRFEELNVHKQSVHDNQHLHGNLIAYRQRLIERIGLDKVEWLESRHEPKKYTIPELQELKCIYKEKLKQLKDKS